MPLPPPLETFLARWREHDVDGIVSLYAPDAEMRDPTLPEPIRGRDALSSYYAEMWEAVPDARLQCRCAEASANAIAWAWRFAGTADGGAWEVVGASCFRLSAGWIVSDHAVWDPSLLP